MNEVILFLSSLMAFVSMARKRLNVLSITSDVYVIFFSFQTNGKEFPLQNEPIPVPENGPVVIDLKAEGVPATAQQVIVYAFFEKEWHYSQPIFVSGSLVVSSQADSGLIEKRLHFASSGQYALSFNTDYFTLPLQEGAAPKITAKVDCPVCPGIRGSQTVTVQVLGYVD